MSRVVGGGAPRGVSGFSGVTPSDAQQYDDLFDGSSLAPKWTAVGASNTLSGGHDSFSSAGSGQHIRQTFAALPANMTLWTRLASPSNPGSMTGLFVVDASGVGNGYSQYTGNNIWTWNISTYAYGSTGAQNGTLAATDIWFKCRKTGGVMYCSHAQHVAGKKFNEQVFGAELAIGCPNVVAGSIGVGSFFSGNVVNIEEFRVRLT